jgi:phage terminase large subunit-like protein
MVQVKKTRADVNIAWIEEHCVIPEGRDVGKPVKLRSWQRDEIRKVYDNPHGTRTAIVSFGKKNAKTTLAAFLLLLHLSGPEAKRNNQLVSTAQSRDQAAVLFALAAKIVRMSPSLSVMVSIRDTHKELYDAELGTLYQALSADASTAHGKSPAFAVHDELGQVRGPRSELYTAIENAMGAHDRPMSIVISTQAPTDADLLSILIDDAQAGADPRTVISLYTAPIEMDPFSDEAIAAANPAFGDFLNAAEIRRQAQQAKRMPALEALYRNYTLNQRVEASSPFVTQTVWAQNGAAAEEGHVLYCGLDLSETNDLTSFVSASVASGGRLSVHPTFFLPENEIEERARKDRVPYDVWARDGFIQLTPGKSIAYQYVAQYLVAIFRTKDVRKVAFDRWNMKHLRPWLIREGLPESLIDDRFVEFGQGYQSMTPALRTLESLLLDSKLMHGNNPVLRMCAANAVVKTDEVGNRKLDKKRSRGRIDGMVALAMAVAMAYENMATRPVFSVPTERLIRAV